MVAAEILDRARLWTSSEENMERLTWRLLCLFAFCIPWSIVASEGFVILTLLASIQHWRLAGGPVRTVLNRPILAFLSAALVAALVGLDPPEALFGLRTYFQLPAILVVYRHVRTDERIVTLLVSFLLGMVITSLHTVWNVASPWEIPRLFPGGMTQSGQLLFALGITISFLLFRVSNTPLVSVAIALFSASLLANLKRGAWLAAFVLLAVFGFARSRTVFLGGLATVVVVAMLVIPVRDRVTDSARDFFLPGSRYDIWVAATDVIRRFPMGVGRKNGTILRDYPNVPQRHKHAHNNFLQITMVHGVLGLATFVWWMGAFGLIAWRNWKALANGPPVEQAASLAVFTTFVAFHVAGCFEYYFGDTEVLQILLVMMGLGLVLRDRRLDAEQAAQTGVASTST